MDKIVTLTEEQIAKIRAWAREESGGQLESCESDRETLLSDLAAANKRADEAEARRKCYECGSEMTACAQCNPELPTAERDTLRARVVELEGALRTITRHPIENFCMGRPDLGIPGYASCQDVARAALAGGKADG